MGRFPSSAFFKEPQPMGKRENRLRGDTSFPSSACCGPCQHHVATHYSANNDGLCKNEGKASSAKAKTARQSRTENINFCSLCIKEAPLDQVYDSQLQENLHCFPPNTFVVRHLRRPTLSHSFFSLHKHSSRTYALENETLPNFCSATPRRRWRLHGL